MLEARGIYERQRQPGGVSDPLLSRLPSLSATPNLPAPRHSFLLSFVVVIVVANVLLVLLLLGFVSSGGSIPSLFASAADTLPTPTSHTSPSSLLSGPARGKLDPLRKRIKDLISPLAPSITPPLTPDLSLRPSQALLPSLPLPLPLPSPFTHHHVVIYNHNFDRLPLPTAHKPGESFHFNSIYQALLYLNRTLHLHLSLHPTTSADATKAALNHIQGLPPCPSGTPPTSSCHSLLSLISHTYDLCPNSDRCRPFHPGAVFSHPLSPRSTWRLVDYWSTPPDENFLQLHPLQHWNPYPYGVNFQSGFLILTAAQAELLENQQWEAYDALRSRELFPSTQTVDQSLADRILAPTPHYSLKMCFYGVGNIFFSTPRWEMIKRLHSHMATHSMESDPSVSLSTASWMYSGDIHCGGNEGCDWFQHRHLVGPGQYLDWVKYLTTCSLMLATGEPIVSPTPLEAVGNGAVFVDIIDNAHGPVHTHTVHGQSYQSQHPWVVKIVGEEWAKLADWTNEENLIGVVMGAINEDFARYKRWVEEREKWGKLRGTEGEGEVVVDRAHGFEYTVDQLGGAHHRVGRIHTNFTLETMGRRIWENLHDPSIALFHDHPLQ